MVERLKKLKMNGDIAQSLPTQTIQVQDFQKGGDTYTAEI
jgi:hypothetical protein